MPVTIKPSPHGANEFRAQCMTHVPTANQAANLSQTGTTSPTIIQSSFQPPESGTTIFSTRNGFVDAAFAAYNQHQHLTIRPDDIWLSILAQFNLYVNANSESLRSTFVSHSGQKHLEVLPTSDIKGDALWGVDWGKFAFKMTSMIAANVKDPSLREWILPAFSTTTKIDQAVAAILMMATLQKYFTYGSAMTCGLPSVTLLGLKSDWENVAEKAERLVTFGEEPTLWYGLLKPVLANFVASFDGPEKPEILDFWRKIAHKHGGSGVSYLSGWITSFCFWDGEGRIRRLPVSDETNNPQGFYDPNEGEETDENVEKSAKLAFVPFDASIYPIVDASNIPPSRASVPVQLDDNGCIIECEMTAGLIGMRVSSSGEDLHGKPGQKGMDAISIEPGWWMTMK